MQPSTTPYRFSPDQELQLQSMQVDALACLKDVQRRVAQVLFRIGAGERMVRMATSDLLETLLARAGACIAASSSFPAHANTQVRRAYLTLHLELALAAWLETDARTASEAATARQCLVVLQDRENA